MRLYALTAASVILAGTVFLTGTVQAQGSGKKKEQLKTVQDKTSYAIGLNVGTNLARQGAEVDLDLFLQGVRDGMGGGELLLSPAEYRSTMKALTTRLKEKKKKKRGTDAKNNLKQGQAFLAANKKKKDVVTLPSGMQYRIVKPGKGEKPKASDAVVTHYRGKLINGVEFDSSYSRKSPATFPVKGVIKGWTEALQLMRVGAKWELFIPSGLAYGKRGSGHQIGPNATLIFDIELLGIK